MALIDAVKDGSVPVVARILAGGADLDARDAEEFDETALMRAAGEGHVSMVKLLLEHSAQMESKNSIGCTALMHAAMQGHANVVSLLVKNGADTNATDFSLKTAADMALDHNHAMVFSILRPEAARQNGEELRRKFDDAQLVHVISTRYRKECGQADAIDPRRVAEELKRELEGGDLPSGPIDPRLLEGAGLPAREYPLTGVRVFNPNSDNAFLTGGDPEEANAIWLRNWRDFLEMARKKGGRCIQIIVPPGLSHMQHAEADMAADKGVPVVRIDFTTAIIEPPRSVVLISDFEEMPGWKELKELQAQVNQGIALPVPMTREEQSQEIAALQCEVYELRDAQEQP